MGASSIVLHRTPQPPVRLTAEFMQGDAAEAQMTRAECGLAATGRIIEMAALNSQASANRKTISFFLGAKRKQHRQLSRYCLNDLQN
jgi:hypothetical protein